MTPAAYAIRQTRAQAERILAELTAAGTDPPWDQDMRRRALKAATAPRHRAQLAPAGKYPR